MTSISLWKPVAHLALIAFLPCLQAATLKLKPETVEAWNEYIRDANQRVQQRLTAGNTFLWMDESPDRVSKVKNKQTVVAPVGVQSPKKIPSGLIHDWIGVAYLPNLNISDVLPVVRDYAKYKEFYRPNVVDSKLIQLDDARDRFSTVLVNKAFFKKTALDSEYEAKYFRVDERHLYTVSQTTHIQEVPGFGSPNQRTLPEDEGSGLIWRLFTVIRFEERDAGLYIEVEAIALSRDIPAAIRAFAEPIVRRVSRDALITALQQTEAAVRAKGVLATH